MPEWNVFRYNFNTKQIEPFNVFHNITFFNDCKAILKRNNGTGDLSNELKHVAMYTYWCRSEYEVMIGEIFDSEHATKVDIYSQLMLNWNAFINYVKEAYKCGLFSSTSTES